MDIANTIAITPPSIIIVVLPVRHFFKDYPPLIHLTSSWLIIIIAAGVIFPVFIFVIVENK
jgi:hypothetical protein